LSRPAGQTSTESDRVYYSLERLDAADGDVILLSAETVDAEEAAALQESPLWRQLSAVRAGEVHTVDGELWLTGGGVLAGQAIVDDLTEVLMP
jgi:iron complex transport system substrate-binding protein